jgi:hypothetical protein
LSRTITSVAAERDANGSYQRNRDFNHRQARLSGVRSLSRCSKYCHQRIALA